MTAPPPDGVDCSEAERIAMRLEEEARLFQYGQRACLPGLFHEAAKALRERDARVTELEESKQWAIEDRVEIIQLRARLALAVQWLEKVDLPLRYEEAEALIEALKEPSHG